MGGAGSPAAPPPAAPHVPPPPRPALPATPLDDADARTQTAAFIEAFVPASQVGVVVDVIVNELGGTGTRDALAQLRGRTRRSGLVAGSSASLLREMIDDFTQTWRTRTRSGTSTSGVRPRRRPRGMRRGTA